MIVRPAGGTGCDGCDPYTTLIMRLEALEERANAIVKSVQGILPDGVGNVTLDTESDTTDPSWGATTKLATGSLVKEVYQENHNYIAAVADDVVDLLADVSELQTQVEDLDPTIVSALQQSVAALQQSVNTLSNTVAGYSAVINDLEDQMPNKVDRTGDTMTGPLNVIDTATGSRNTQAVNGNRLQNDLDAYETMVRTVNNQNVNGIKYNITTGHGGLVTVGGNSVRWVRLAYTTIGDSPVIIEFMPEKMVNANLLNSGRLYVIIRANAGKVTVKPTFYEGSGLSNLIYVTWNGEHYEIWYHYSEAGTNKRINALFQGGYYNRNWTLDGATTMSVLDPSSYILAIQPTVIT